MRAPTAVVTGAGSGIGRVVCRTLLDAGYRVVLTGRRLAPLEETADGHPEAIFVTGDVTAPADVAHLFDKAVDEGGRVDLLFNNAGVWGPRSTIDEIPDDEWHRTIATNLTGSYLCAKHAFRVMRAQSPRGGRIINNGSVSAHSPRPASAAYTASKHAITGLTKAISIDGRPYDIACGQIDIGNAATELLETATSTDIGTGSTEPSFDAIHVGRAVLSMAQLPLDVNVQFMTLLATRMPYIGRG